MRASPLHRLLPTKKSAGGSFLSWCCATRSLTPTAFTWTRQTGPRTHETSGRFFMTRANSEEGLQSVRALLFDTFGTVVDWRSGIACEVADFLRHHGLPGDPERFADEWRALYQPAMEVVRRGDRPFTRLDLIHRENLDQVLRSWGIDPGAFNPAELDELNRAWHRLDPWPDSVAGLCR